MNPLVPGYNPIIWDCSRRGCWNEKCRPNIEYFAGALPRRISMTDLDATVEVNGHFLFLEWKSYEGAIPTGQRIYFERLTALSPRITAVIVAGDPETMSVDAIQRVHAGRMAAWRDCDLEELFERIAAWSQRVDMRVVHSSEDGAAA